MLGHYPDFLKDFIDAGYRFRFLTRENPVDGGCLYLRHDIDFDIDCTLELARIEADLGVAATYFFMLSSDSYNPLSEENRAKIQGIRNLGHKISLHFDASIYDDPHSGLIMEKSIFESAFPTEIDILSFHRPAPWALDNEDNINGVAHTYQPRFFRDIFYSSDSQGMWRFGDPRESREFRTGKSIHLLIHPVWWMFAASTPQEVMDKYVDGRIRKLLTHIGNNCKSFDAGSSVHAGVQK